MVLDEETKQVALTVSGQCHIAGCVGPKRPALLLSQAVDRNTLLQLRGTAAKGYAFDRRYDQDAISDMIYDDCIAQIVEKVFKVTAGVEARRSPMPMRRPMPLRRATTGRSWRMAKQEAGRRIRCRGGSESTER